MAKKVVISVVMPCLDEVQSISRSIKEAMVGIRGWDGEIVVIDNGSVDGSLEKIKGIQQNQKGKGRVAIRLVQESQRGYGAALLRGFNESRGSVVVMGDSDGSYDFGEVSKLVLPIIDGSYDLVVGSRMKGKQDEGAMPVLHRFIGTPLLTALLNSLFNLKLSDSQSGYRAILKGAYLKLGMRMTGMEFASEMLVRASRAKLRMAEVPISYRKRSGESKLDPLNDAWRHIRFLLLFSPGRLFTVPGVLLFAVGLGLFVVTAPGPFSFGRGILDVHTLSISGMAMILGFQLLSLGMYSRVYGKYSFGIKESDVVDYFIERFQLEQGIKAGGLLTLTGLAILGSLGAGWVVSGFPALSQVREVLVGTVLVLLGMQMIFGSFFLSLLRGEAR